MTAVTADATPQPSVYEEALAAWDSGICVIRAKNNGSKRPVGAWKDYQKTRPDRETVARWFADGWPGIGILTGAASGGVEMLEFEGRAVNSGMLSEFLEMAIDNGLDELWNRIADGWSEWTPSDGCHLYYRVDGTPEGNTKLAMDPDEGCLIETRGEGGFSIIAPSGGSVHPTGKAWVREAGGPATMATITQAERSALFGLLATFDKSPVKPQQQRVELDSQHRTAHIDYAGDSWMDKVAAHVNRTNSWASLLGKQGYSFVKQVGTEEFWKHANATAEHSVTINGNGTDRLLNFSTSLVDKFVAYTGTDAKTPTYDKLDFIAAYEHGGDRVEAAKAEDPGFRDEWVNRRREEDRRIFTLVGNRKSITPDEDEDADEEPTDHNGDGGDGGEPTNDPDELCPSLPEEFWEARPVFQQIRQAAWSKQLAADGVLGAVLARAAFMTDYRIILPDVVSRHGSLNLIVGLVGGAGDGKGSSLDLAKRLLPGLPVTDPKAAVVSAGSGEGIPRSFYEQVPAVDDTGETIKNTSRKDWKLVRRHVMLRVDEGEVLQAIGSRMGSTIWTVWRSMWSGESLGFNNADQDRRFPVEELSYRISAAVAIQPKLAAGILEDIDGGTPQRFIWTSLTDVRIPDEPPSFPGMIKWTPPIWDRGEVIDLNGWRRGVMQLDQSIAKTLISEQIARRRGQLKVSPLDTHRNLSKLKTAGILAILDKRLNITVEDWELAEMILSTSDAVRSWTSRTIDTATLLRQLRADQRQGERQVMVNTMTAAAQAAAVRVGKVIARHVHNKHSDGTACKSKCLKDAVGTRDRDYLDIGRDYATTAGWVEVDHRHWLIPGDSVPTSPPPKGGSGK